MISVEDSAKIVDGHYSLRLSFRRENISMPDNCHVAEQHDNCHVAEQRLSNLKRKFLRNELFHEEYTSFLNDDIEKGYTEAVPQEQLKRKDAKVWYIPQ